MRVFIALCLPDEAIDQIVQIQSAMPPSRLTPEDNLHLTLAFVGDASLQDCDTILDGLSSIQHEPIPLTLAGVQIFGGKHGQVVALGADGGPGLTMLHDRVRSRMHGVGLPLARRRFRPHVTLARLPGRADTGPFHTALRGAKTDTFKASRFGLFESILQPEGAIYEAIGLFPLTEHS